MARDRYLSEAVVRLRTGEWIAWAREGTPTGPWRRLPAEAWNVLGVPRDMNGWPRRDDVWHGCVQVRGSDLRYYGVVVCPATRRRPPSVAAVRAAVRAAEAEQAKPLTLRQAEDIACQMGASRELGRAAHRQLRRPGR